jgi:hypothetical protein
MKNSYEPAMIIGSCILIGFGVIGTVLLSPRLLGPGVTFLAIAFGVNFLYQSWKRSYED